MRYYCPIQDGGQDGDTDAQKKGTATPPARPAPAFHLGRPPARGRPQAHPRPAAGGAPSRSARSRRPPPRACDPARPARRGLVARPARLPPRARGTHRRLGPQLPPRALLRPGRPRPPTRRSARQARALERRARACDPGRPCHQPRPRSPGRGLGRPLPRPSPHDSARGAPRAGVHLDELQKAPTRGRVEGARLGPELPARGVGDRPVLIGSVVRRLAGSLCPAASRRASARGAGPHLASTSGLATPRADWPRRTATVGGVASARAAGRRCCRVALRARPRQPEGAPASPERREPPGVSPVAPPSAEILGLPRKCLGGTVTLRSCGLQGKVDGQSEAKLATFTMTWSSVGHEALRPEVPHRQLFGVPRATPWTPRGEPRWAWASAHSVSEASSSRGG